MGQDGSSKKQPDLEPQAHPVKEQLPGVQFCVNSPPPWIEALVLGFQHYVLSLGITVLMPSLIVPLMGGGDEHVVTFSVCSRSKTHIFSEFLMNKEIEKARVIQSLLFASGVTTLFQSLFGSRLPTMAVGSFAYVVPVTSIVIATRYGSISNPRERFVETIRGIQGALIIAACFQMIMGFLGLWRNVVRFFSPLSVAPLVTFTGLGLCQLGFPTLSKCVEIGLPMLMVMVFVSQYLPSIMKTKTHIYDRYALLLSIAIIWLYALLLTSSSVYNKRPIVTQLSCRTDRSGLVTSSPWIYIPYPFQWGTPTFHVGESLAMMAASFVSLFESTGAFLATSRYASATPVPSSVLSRGVGWLGFGVLINGLLGSVTGFTASVENAGLLALTRVGSRRVVQISAGYMIFFSVFGKFGAVLASLPLPILAAAYCVFFGYVSSAGLGYLQFCNLNSFRTKFILGFSFFMAITVPQYFQEFYHISFRTGHTHTGSSWFDDIVIVVFTSHATVAGMVALFLECTMSRKAEESRKDSGVQWWEKFNLYTSDVKNDEFYALPFRLNKLFPSL